MNLRPSGYEKCVIEKMRNLVAIYKDFSVVFADFKPRFCSISPETASHKDWGIFDFGPQLVQYTEK